MDAARPPNQRPAPPHVQPLAPPQYQPPAPRPYPQHAREDDGQSDPAGDAATAASRRASPPMCVRHLGNARKARPARAMTIGS